MLITRNKAHPPSPSADLWDRLCWFAAAAKQRCVEYSIIWMTRVFDREINTSKWDLCSSMQGRMSDLSIFSLWDVCEWRIRRTIQRRASVWHNSKKTGESLFICVKVEGVSYQTILKRSKVSAAGSWTRTTALDCLHSIGKAAHRKKQLHWAEDGSAHGILNCKTMFCPKFVF